MTNVTRFETVPATFVDYSCTCELSLALRYRLLTNMPTRSVTLSSTSKSKRPRFSYVSVDLYSLWFVLHTLKRVLGERAFNSNVGVRIWDMDTFQVGVVHLTSAQFVTALKELRKTLAEVEENETDPHNKPSVRCPDLAVKCLAYFSAMCPVNGR